MMRVIEPDVDLMKGQVVGHDERIWNDLDGEKLVFQNQYCPCACYFGASIIFVSF